jgi:peptidoglycan-associated lipoprotein
MVRGGAESAIEAMFVSASVKIAAAAKPAAIAACLLFVTACAENKPPAPEAQAVHIGPESGTPQDFVLNVGDRVFFNENSTELSPTATSALDKQAAWLARFTAYSISIEGHSDEKGSKAKNKKLSEQRAQAVRSYLAGKGIDPGRLHAVSFGRERRVANCNDVSCWSQNRRVVTVLRTAADPLLATRREPPARMPTHAAPKS